LFGAQKVSVAIQFDARLLTIQLKDIISGWRFWKHETKAAQAEAV
jgi:hypothetical protein